MIEKIFPEDEEMIEKSSAEETEIVNDEPKTIEDKIERIFPSDIEETEAALETEITIEFSEEAETEAEEEAPVQTFNTEPVIEYYESLKNGQGVASHTNPSYKDEAVFYYSPTKQKKDHTTLKRFFSMFLAFVLGSGLTLFATHSLMITAVEEEVAKISYNNGISKPSQTPTEAATPIAYENKSMFSVVDIAKNVGPTVVGIISRVERQTFFGIPQISEGSGSGIIITGDGYIITNNHVVEGAKELRVILNNGKEHEAKLIGTDPRTDLAVVKIEVSGIHSAILGDSAQLAVGELAVAIGNPLGNELAGSVTVGVISALNRSITIDDKKLNLIQTDAAINPGNSGGALVNSYGEVIGINTVKMSATGVEGIGFAIPINEAKPIIEDLMKNGYVKGRPIIGISGRNVSEQDSKNYDIPVGVYVAEVSPYSSAERAGIKYGDVIIKINGITVTTIEELNMEKENFKAGDTVSITFVREGEEATVEMLLQEEKPQLLD